MCVNELNCNLNDNNSAQFSKTAPLSPLSSAAFSLSHKLNILFRKSNIFDVSVKALLSRLCIANRTLLRKDMQTEMVKWLSKSSS